MKTGRLVSPIYCQVNNTVEAHKSIKNIVKIVHLPSVVQSEFYDATRILFVCEENKNNDFFQQFVSSVSLRSTILEIIHWTQTAYALLYQPQHKDVLFSIKSKCKYTLSTYEVDTEERMLLAFSG